MGRRGLGRPRHLLVVTPACNEAEHLRAVADSLAAQTLRPTHWVIATNGCQDDTEAVADAIAACTPWVTALHLGSTAGRAFAAKAAAVDAGVAEHGLDGIDLVACIDGDVELPPDYFERVAEVMGDDPTVGIAGGVYREPVTSEGRVGRAQGGHVPGPAQVFAADAWRAIGGYPPLEFGGLDAAACIRARQLGWSTRPLEDLEFRHRRPMGTGGGVSPVRAEYRKGRQDWDLGNAWWFEAAKVGRKVLVRPRVVGAIARAAGFVRGAGGRERGTDADFVEFVRTEQRERLAALVRRRGRDG